MMPGEVLKDRVLGPLLCVFQTSLGGGSGLDPCLFLQGLMQASESSSIHLPYGD